MRKIVTVSTLAIVAAGAIAVSVRETRVPHEAMTADLERDLSLATSVPQKRTGVVSAIEQGRTGAPSGNERGVRAPVITPKRAPSAARSETVMEVAAAPTQTDPAQAPPAVAPPIDSSASAPEPVARTQSMAVDNYPAPQAPVAVGGPSAGGSVDGERGSSSTGSGDDRRGNSGRGHDTPNGPPPLTPGGVIGAILRGGAAGVDNCEPNRRRTGDAVGTIGAVGGMILGGGGMPGGSIAGGPRPSGRRW